MAFVSDYYLLIIIIIIVIIVGAKVIEVNGSLVNYYLVI
jgi:hypothetical protein